MAEMAADLEAFLEGDGTAAGRAARERFYDAFLKVSAGIARRFLAGRSQLGGIHQAAEDVASENVLVLLRQEERRSGVFKPGWTREERTGYLSRTIWRGCRWGASRSRLSCADFALDSHRSSETGLLTIETLRDKCFENEGIRLRLQGAIEDMRKDPRGRFRKLPAGLTPMDCVLDEGVATALGKGVPLRTIQRYSKYAREELGSRMGIRLDARGKAVGSRGPGRVRKEREPEMEG